MDQTNFGEDQRMGSQDNVTSIPLQKTQRRNVAQPPYKNVQYGKKDVDKDELALPV